MSKIYCVDYSDCKLYDPYELVIGYFSSLEKAIAAAKRYADEKFENYDENILADGHRSFYGNNGAVFVTEQELDVYLPDTW